MLRSGVDRQDVLSGGRPAAAPSCCAAVLLRAVLLHAVLLHAVRRRRGASGGARSGVQGAELADACDGPLPVDGLHGQTGRYSSSGRSSRAHEAPSGNDTARTSSQGR